MKTTALVISLIVMSACASGDKFDRRSFDCSSGEALTIMAGMPPSQSARSETWQDSLTLQIEVANNSDRDVTVKSIRVDQFDRDRSPYRVEPSFREFNHELEPGDDHVFEVPMAGRTAPVRITESEVRSSVLLAVTVSLTNGDQYRCRFEVPAPY